MFSYKDIIVSWLFPYLLFISLIFFESNLYSSKCDIISSLDDSTLSLFSVYYYEKKSNFLEIFFLIFNTGIMIALAALSSVSKTSFIFIKFIFELRMTLSKVEPIYLEDEILDCFSIFL